MPAVPETILYHSTPYAEQILAEGLQPHQARTRVSHFYDNHPDVAIRAQGASHRGSFVFATQNEMESLLYAFKVGIDRNDPATFGRGMHMVTSVLVDHNNPQSRIGVVIVGNAAEWKAAITTLQPTRFTIVSPFTEQFTATLTPDGHHNGDWVSRQRIPPHGLKPEAISLEKMAGRIQFFECTDNFKGANLPFAVVPFEKLWKDGKITPANHALGLPETALTTGTPYTSPSIRRLGSRLAGNGLGRTALLVGLAVGAEALANKAEAATSQMDDGAVKSTIQGGSSSMREAAAAANLALVVASGGMSSMPGNDTVIGRVAADISRRITDLMLGDVTQAVEGRKIPARNVPNRVPSGM